MADDTIDAIGHELMSRLYGDKPAEAIAEHKDRPQTQGAAQGEQQHPKPADRVAIDDPDVHTIGIGRKIAIEQPDEPKRNEHPAVATIFALAGAEIAARKQGSNRQQEEHDGERNKRRHGKECRRTTPAEDGKAKIEGSRNEDE